MGAWTFEVIKLPGYEGRAAVVTSVARNIGRAIRCRCHEGQRVFRWRSFVGYKAFVYWQGRSCRLVSSEMFVALQTSGW